MFVCLFFTHQPVFCSSALQSCPVECPCLPSTAAFRVRTSPWEREPHTSATPASDWPAPSPPRWCVRNLGGGAPLRLRPDASVSVFLLLPLSWFPHGRLFPLKIYDASALCRALTHKGVTNIKAIHGLKCVQWPSLPCSRDLPWHRPLGRGTREVEANLRNSKPIRHHNDAHMRPRILLQGPESHSVSGKQHLELPRPASCLWQ